MCAHFNHSLTVNGKGCLYRKMQGKILNFIDLAPNNTLLQTLLSTINLVYSRPVPSHQQFFMIDNIWGFCSLGYPSQDILKWNHAKSHTSIMLILIIRWYGNFVQSTTVILMCPVLNCKTVWGQIHKIWVIQFSQDLSSRRVSRGYYSSPLWSNSGERLVLVITTEPCQQHANCSYITGLDMTNLSCRQETGIISCHDVKQN